MSIAMAYSLHSCARGDNPKSAVCAGREIALQTRI